MAWQAMADETPQTQGNEPMKKLAYRFECEASAKAYAADWLACYRDGYAGSVLIFQALNGLWIVETSRLASCD
jgi:hypothetical protein